MRMRGFFWSLGLLALVPLSASAQWPGWAPASGGMLPNGDPYAYGNVPGYRVNGLGYTLGWRDIYDSRPYSSGWYYPNVHWPSRDYYFTYRDGTSGYGGYLVHYPSLTAPRANSYTIQTTAHVEVCVPTADTEVYIEGVRMGTTGVTRSFVTPTLNPGDEYTYEITARWVEDGKAREQKRLVQIRAGDTTKVTMAAR